MKQLVNKILIHLLAGLVCLAARIVIYSSRNALVRSRLGQLYTMMRGLSHENYAMVVRGNRDLHPTVEWGLDTVFYGEGIISIGEHTYIGRDSFIVCNPSEAKIGIGRHCAISHSVHIRTSNYMTTLHFKNALTSPLDWGNIIIGDYVWIGAHVVICGGVTIGDNSIIGANSVVTKDISPNTIYGGVPARLIGCKHGVQQEVADQELLPEMVQGTR